MARTVDELLAHQRAHAFKLQVYRLLKSSPEANRDWRLRSQLSEAAAGGPMNIAEGFRRFVPAEFSRFLGYALSSMEEGVRRVLDGADRGYFSLEDATACANLGTFAIRTTGKLNVSVRGRIPEERAARKRGERWRPKARATDARCSSTTAPSTPHKKNRL